jgi:hypothetical protein
MRPRSLPRGDCTLFEVVVTNFSKYSSSGFLSGASRPAKKYRRLPISVRLFLSGHDEQQYQSENVHQRNEHDQYRPARPSDVVKSGNHRFKNQHRSQNETDRLRKRVSRSPSLKPCVRQDYNDYQKDAAPYNGCGEPRKEFQPANSLRHALTVAPLFLLENCSTVQLHLAS